MIASPNKSLRQCRIANVFLSFIGLLLSSYALYVEIKKNDDSDYVAMCDINELLACSKVFSTKYAKGFGIVAVYLGEDSIFNQPNGLYGIITYTILFVLSHFNSSRSAAEIQKILVILSNCMTPYLAYILYKIIGAVCIVCVATYAVNFLLLLIAYRRVDALKSKSSPSRKSTKKVTKKTSKRE